MKISALPLLVLGVVLGIVPVNAAAKHRNHQRAVPEVILPYGVYQATENVSEPLSISSSANPSQSGGKTAIGFVKFNQYRRPLHSIKLYGRKPEQILL